MKEATLARSIQEAERFLKAARTAANLGKWWKKESGEYQLEGKQAAAAKRASMDLSRALADLRQGR